MPSMPKSRNTKHDKPKLSDNDAAEQGAECDHNALNFGVANPAAAVATQTKRRKSAAALQVALD